HSTTITTVSAFFVSGQNLKNYEQGKPNDPNYDYLKEFAALKKYIDYDRYPNFRLGIGTTVNDYLNNASVRGLTNDNFTETVAGNAMKMASCVNNNGDMNFSTVIRYVNAAEKAGINVYGHTLAWHSQQPNGWLRGLIKDKPPVPFENPDTMVNVETGRKDFRTQQNVGWTADKSQYGFSLNFSSSNGLNVHTTKKISSWEVQFVAYDNIPADAGKTYTLTYEIKGSDSGTMHSKLGDWGNGKNVDFPFSTDWEEISVKYTSPINNPFLLLQCGDFVGDIYIRNIKVEESVGAMKVKEDRRCLKVEASARQSEVWDNQFWILCPTAFNAGQNYVFTADIRADKAAKASTQIHNDPGSYVDYNAFGNIDFGTEWKTIKLTGNFTCGGKSIAFNLSELSESNTYYLDNISLKIGGVEKITNGSVDNDELGSFRMKKASGAITPPQIMESGFILKVPQSTPLSKTEKKEILCGAMEKWIKGMMNACGGKVKAWDVVNEAISGGGNDGSGNYTLQHSEGFNGDATWDVGGDAFYWQDHMGDLEYVRSAVKYARMYGPEDIKLFINDYNLESDWDDNKKLKSLINWIKKWEADGETYVDGIGTQMHISYYENSGTQTSKKNAITKMFRLLAGSGKLIRVSEFDMGYVNASGKDVPTGEMTEAQHKNMADYYEWILKEYFRLIPPEQQWGICFWCPTDSPANSGWRANTPVGIWTNSTFYRKHAYAGIVRGLGGVIYTGVDEKSTYEPASINGTATGIYNINGFRYPADTRLSDLPSGLYVINGKVIKK
ncbi:MAG: endo-1,4-beta-xylanase, partial [Muribaculaceae bacterium]|nr:endo-1,4-beta-xylanase [Muribaculaceae bacterium]